MAQTSPIWSHITWIHASQLLDPVGVEALAPVERERLLPAC